MKTTQSLTLLCLSLCLAAGAAWAQSYPSRPVRVLVPFPPGGAPDLVARTLSQRLQDRLGQPFVIENRTGAGGNIAADAVAKAAPDGYTLLSTSDGPLVINPAVYKEMPFNTLRDLAPINGFFFQIFVGVQTGLAFLLTVLMGPPLISRDLANNALPLYLCRPLS